MGYEEIKKLTDLQTPEDEMINIISQIVKHENSLYIMVLRAYFIGLINGKRSERIRRVQR